MTSKSVGEFDGMREELKARKQFMSSGLAHAEPRALSGLTPAGYHFFLISLRTHRVTQAGGRLRIGIWQQQ